MVNEYGKKLATASLVLGIISIVFWFFGVGAIVSIITGIVGIVMASKAKNVGFIGGIRTGGLVTSIIGLCGGTIVLIAVLAVGSLALMFM